MISNYRVGPAGIKVAKQYRHISSISDEIVFLSITYTKNGGAEGNRTPDLYNAIVALSQLSYGPIVTKMLRPRLGAGGGC